MIIDKKGTIEISAPRTITVGFYVEANKRLRRRLKDNYAMVVPAVELDEGAGTQYGQWLNHWISTSKPSDDQIKAAVQLIVQLHPQAKFLGEQPKLMDIHAPEATSGPDVGLAMLQRYANTIQNDYRQKKDKTADEEDADIEVISPNIVKTNNFAAAYFLHGGGRKYKEQMPWCGGRSQSLYNNYGGPGKNRYIVFPDGPDKTVKINGQDIPWSNYAFVVSVRNNGTMNNVNDPGNCYPNDSDYDRDGATKAFQILNDALGLEIEQTSEWSEAGLIEGDWDGFNLEEAQLWANHNFDNADEAAPWREYAIDPEVASDYVHNRIPVEAAFVFENNKRSEDDISDLSNIWDEMPDGEEGVEILEKLYESELLNLAGKIDMKESDIAEFFAEKGLQTDWSSRSEEKKMMYLMREDYDISEEDLPSDTISDLASDFNLNYDRIKGFMLSGMSLEEAYEWLERDEEEGLELGLTVAEYERLEELGLDQDKIKKFSSDYLNWNVDLETALAWYNAGFQFTNRYDSGGTAEYWLKHGFSPEEASVWKAARFSPEGAKRQQSLGLGPNDAPGWSKEIDQFVARQKFNMDYADGRIIYNKLKELGVDLDRQRDIQYFADAAKSDWSVVFKIIDEFGVAAAEGIGGPLIREGAEKGGQLLDRMLQRFRAFYTPNAHPRHIADLAISDVEITPENAKRVLERLDSTNQYAVDTILLNQLRDNPEAVIDQWDRQKFKETRTQEFIQAGIDPSVAGNAPDNVTPDEYKKWSQFIYRDLSYSYPEYAVLQAIAFVKDQNALDSLPVFAKYVDRKAMSPREVAEYVQKIPGWSAGDLDKWLQAAKTRYPATSLYEALDDSLRARSQNLTPEQWVADTQEKTAQQAPEFQRDLTEVLEEVRRLIEFKGPVPELIAVMRGLKRKIELEKSFGLREAKRMQCLDSMQRRTEVDTSEVKPGDKVQFTGEFHKTGPRVESGEFGIVRRVGSESFEVETIGSTAKKGGVEVGKCTVEVPVDQLVLLLHNDDPRA